MKHSATAQLLSIWQDDPYLLYKDPTQSKEILNDLLKSTFKSTTRQGDLILGSFKLDQVWEQIEHHTNKVNTRIMNRISNMISDDDFILELQQQTTDTVKKPSKEEKKKR